VGNDRQVIFTAQLGLATTLLELAATSIGAGIVVAGFIVASIATLSGGPGERWTAILCGTSFSAAWGNMLSDDRL
jgi:hypothetical protein